MGTRTVGSEPGNGGGGGGGGVHFQEAGSYALGRQGSLYHLTLDEVQNQLGDLGKPLSSMNLDELLKSVWTAEANQCIGGVSYDAAQQDQLASASSLNRQSSLMLSRDLSKKTVDEVWQHIQQGHKNATRDRKTQDRQPTLGEMTLEDFLVKAGVVAESCSGKKNAGHVLGVNQVSMSQQHVPQQAQWMHYQIPPIHQPVQQGQHNMMTVFMPSHPVQQSLPIGANPVMDAAYPETQMTMSSSPLIGTLSDTQTPGRKRIAPGDFMEKTVERRHKRMIKNRESAARSRARKQAYTHELENKVSRLEEENERLKRQRCYMDLCLGCDICDNVTWTCFSGMTYVVLSKQLNLVYKEFDSSITLHIRIDLKLMMETFHTQLERESNCVRKSQSRSLLLFFNILKRHGLSTRCSQKSLVRRQMPDFGSNFKKEVEKVLPYVLPPEPKYQLRRTSSAPF